MRHKLGCEYSRGRIFDHEPGDRSDQRNVVRTLQFVSDLGRETGFVARHQDQRIAHG
jgi:hypothetical protein